MAKAKSNEGEKIQFDKQMYDSKKRKLFTEPAEGILYTAKNGVKVALHKEGNLWYATELTTGRLVCRREEGFTTMKAAKAEVEKVSAAVAKLLKGNQTTTQRVAPSKPTAANIKRTVPSEAISLQTSKSTQAVNKQIRRAVKQTNAKSKKDKPAKAATLAPKSATTFTVMAGRKSKTFATKEEAKAYGKQCKERTGKKYAIRESKKKPSHRVVSFTAKNK